MRLDKLKIASILVFAMLALALIGVKLRYGSGAPYVDLSTAPLISENQVERLVTLDFPPGNVAVSQDGRIFFNYHPFAKPARFAKATVFELVNGKAEPFPSLEFQKSYQGVFGMTVDRRNRIWFIEPGGFDFPMTRLIAFDIATRQEVLEYWFPKGKATFAQDLRVTADGRWVILADTGALQFSPPGLIVFDVAAKSFKTVLGAGAATSPQNWVIQTKFGPHHLAYGLITFSVGLDGIEISPDQKWLYFAPMSHDSLYRVPLADVLQANEMDSSLAQKVEFVSKKPLSDGITIDDKGNVLLTDVEHGGIARVSNSAERNLKTLVKLPQVVWADGIVITPGHRIIFTDSAIPSYINQLTLPPSRETIARNAPYFIYSFPESL